MHQYKVHLPQRNNWDLEDHNMMDSFFLSGINNKPYVEDKDYSDPSSLDDIPMYIDGSETETVSKRENNTLLKRVTRDLRRYTK